MLTIQIQQEYLESADLCQGKSGLDPESWLQNLMGSSLSKDTSCDKPFMKIWSFFPEMWFKLWKNALSCNFEESVKKFLDLYPDADDFENLISYKEQINLW